jgi:tellurite resistance protein
MTMICTKINDIGKPEPTLCRSNFKTSGRTGMSYPLNRPSFRAGTDSISTPNVPSLQPNRRSGVGNHSIVRNNFLATPVASRAMRIVPFEKLQLQTLRDEGVKIAIGDKTLEKLVNVQVDDPSDTEWLAEYARRRALGQSDEQLKNNQPLGRPQRKIKRTTLLEQRNLDFKDKLEQLTTAVNAGFATSNADKAKVVSELALLVDRVRSLVSLTRDQYEQIIEITEKINFPKDWRSVAASRYLTKQEFQANKGMIFLYILNKAQNKNKPIQVGNQLNDLTVLTNRWSGNKRDDVLDLETLILARPEIFGLATPTPTPPTPVQQAPPDSPPASPTPELF